MSATVVNWDQARKIAELVKRHDELMDQLRTVSSRERFARKRVSHRVKENLVWARSLRGLDPETRKALVARKRSLRDPHQAQVS